MKTNPRSADFSSGFLNEADQDVKEEKGKSAAEQEAYRSEVANAETAESVVTEPELMTEKPEEKEKTDLVQTRKGSSRKREARS